MSDSAAVEGVLASIDDRLLDLHREWLENDFEGYARASSLGAQGRAVDALVRNHSEKGGVTVLIRSNAVLADAALGEKLLRLLSKRFGSSVQREDEVSASSRPSGISLVPVSSVIEIDSILKQCLGGGGSEVGALYLSAFYSQLVLLGALQARGEARSLHLVDWAKRQNTFMERAKAGSCGALLSASSLPTAREGDFRGQDEVVLGVQFPTPPRGFPSI
eukprot:CAMPEP_0172637542 /NCGR_PEP_ID=MMETSP1068-20121228/209494_1 /TAXON_ID=35684 /ORGANISM="Pseudopedinella elastica, Strain CCMP716" /LENGTH=218 /DNA_ID=CAMNT_0013450227 /DNA_START=393 /DNA_END=1049 /DNA_ORIENTATION=-